MRTEYGSGYSLVAPTEKQLKLFPYEVDPTKPGILFLHGWGGSAIYALDIADWSAQVALVRSIIKDGYPMLSVDYGGTEGWGGPTAMARLVEAKTYMHDIMKIPEGKIHVIGVSMGGLSSFNFARNHPDLVRSVSAFIPVLDLGSRQAANYLGSAFSINAAYGGVYVDSDRRSLYNPAWYILNDLYPEGMPTWMSYSTNDDWGPLSAYTAVSAHISPKGGSVGDLGHSNAALNAIDESEFLSFLKAN